MKSQSIWRRLLKAVLKIALGKYIAKLESKKARGSFIQRPGVPDDTVPPPTPGK